MLKKVPMMSWGDRFALIDAFNPSNAAICAAFGLSPAELKTAMNLRQAGTFIPNQKLDVNKIGNIFPTIDNAHHTDVRLEGNSNSPQTFTKKAAIPKPAQKRGRKGDKIASALMAVPSIPVPVEQFAQQYNVSVAVLRQSKRFLEDMPTEIIEKIGHIQVKQDKSTKVLMIWREDV